MTTLHLIVDGLVQGVGFRAFVSRAARVHGVRGWVRNRSDGAVEIAAQGAGEAFLDEIARGPRWARVRSVSRTETDEPPFDDFALRW